MAPLSAENDAIGTTMSIIGGRWKVILLCKLKLRDGIRFNQLMREIEGVTPRMLTKQLKELEQDGMVVRRVHSDAALRVEYALSERGRSIIPVLTAMIEWGLENMLPDPE